MIYYATCILPQLDGHIPENNHPSSFSAHVANQKEKYQSKYKAN